MQGSGFGFTPLHMACGHGHADVARLFIAAGGATEAMGDRGYTPLHLTALHGRTECAQVLLEAGADIGCVDIDGFCPIHLAARGGHDKVLPCRHQLVAWWSQSNWNDQGVFMRLLLFPDMRLEW